MEKPDLTGLTKAQEDYVDFLEGSLNGTTDLLKELSLFNKICSDDMRLIRNGEALHDGSNLKYIKSDKDDIVFNRVMTLIAKFKELQAVEQSMTINSTVKKKAKEDAPIKNIQGMALSK